MPLLNGLLYLMLLSAGISTAVILLDLKKREDEAYAKLERLYAGRQVLRSGQIRATRSGMGNARLPHRPTESVSLSQASVRRTSFLEMDERKEPMISKLPTEQVSYDFATSHKASVSQSITRSHASYHQDTSCCA